MQLTTLHLFFHIPQNSQGLGLLATALYQEFGVPAGRQGVVFSAMSAGLTAGAFFWGLAVDVIGRKWAFNMTVLITCVFVSFAMIFPCLRFAFSDLGFGLLTSTGIAGCGQSKLCDSLRDVCALWVRAGRSDSNRRDHQ